MFFSGFLGPLSEFGVSSPFYFLSNVLTIEFHWVEELDRIPDLSKSYLCGYTCAHTEIHLPVSS